MTSRGSSLQRLFARLANQGPGWFLSALRDRLHPVRPRLRGRALALAQGRHLLEIGGPSRLFSARGALPVYAGAASVDNVNFSRETAWEERLVEGGPFVFRRGARPGRQFLREAARLDGLPDASYDGLLSSHCLEHLANPLGALLEWRRVTRPDGFLLLVVPDPQRCFDHRRPVTELAHLEADLLAGTAEDDSSHFDEVLRLHDLRLDPAAGDSAAFRQRVLDNARQRCVHHHVFSVQRLAECLVRTGWQPLACEAFAPLHIAALARRPAP